MANPRIDDLRKRLEKDPNSRLFAQLAEELRKDGELEDAIRVSREGLQKHPAYPSARMTLGRALLDTGDLAAARIEFESVLKGAPDNILASRFLGECLEGLGELEPAQARYKATLALAPGDKTVSVKLQALEERLKQASAAPPAPVKPAEPAPAAAAAEPPPIPLVSVEAPMELERPHEAAARTTAPAAAAPARAPATPAAEPAAEAAREEREEPPPIPLVQADEAFELERPYEVPAAPSPTPAPAQPPQPVSTAAGPGGASEFVFEEEPAPTLPLGTPAPVFSEPAPAAVAKPEAVAPPLAPVAPPEPLTGGSVPIPVPAHPPLEPEPVLEPAPEPELVLEPAPEPEPEPAPEPVVAPEPAVMAAPEAVPIITPEPDVVFRPIEAERPAESVPEPAPAVSVPPATATPPPAPVEPAPTAHAESPAIISSTLAELYFGQGHTDKAVEVYRQLLEREPANERARARLAELVALEGRLRAEEAHQAAQPEPVDSRAARRQAIERTIARLEALLAAIRRE